MPLTRPPRPRNLRLFSEALGAVDMVRDEAEEPWQFGTRPCVVRKPHVIVTPFPFHSLTLFRSLDADARGSSD
jgi:hypothetical protein